MNSRNEIESELENCRMQLSKLEKENEELVRSLSEVNEKLHDSERLKGHFISNITNEIVNPFTSVLALAENIKRLKEGEIPMAHHMAELIFEEAFHLDFQLKNIFAAALIEAGKEQVKCSVINLNDLNHQISEYFRQQLDKKRIQLSISFSNESSDNDQISFTSDREKLDIILKNLISNSIKYSPEDSVVELKYFMGKKELHFEVSDQGKGINPEDRKIIFDRFKQLDEKINSINTGHGLGLSIVQAYAEMLGGKVRLNDNFDKGVNVMVIISESAEASDWDDLEDFLLDSEASY
jgi:signal transduction histidine kinase